MASSVLDMPVLRYLWTSKQEYQVASWRAEMKIWGWVGCAVGKKSSSHRYGGRCLNMFHCGEGSQKKEKW